MEKIIRVKNLRKAYKKETAVENVCFELTPGVSWDYWGQTD
ncbi:hypothetical protein AALB52_03225 [Lachnospiraceae bacterium 38-14]|nr:hypothetical protein [Roseburia sp. 1XD42-69]MCX4320221.1 hypothetical protein [Lachnospiraceae bacterium]